MPKHHLVLLCALSSALSIWACASSEDEAPHDTTPEGGMPNGNDAGVADSGAPRDAAPVFCDGGSDCAIYPVECRDETLCAHGAINGAARLLGLWAAADNDIWTSGTMGLVLHYNGTDWKTIRTDRDETLRSVGGTGPTDVWFSATDRFLMHTQGVTSSGQATWEIYDTSSVDTAHVMSSIWGNAEQGMWGVVDNGNGSTGLIFHSFGWQPGSGPAWVLDYAPSWPDPPGPFGGRSLLGFGTTDVWSGWVNGRLYRRVDGKWQEQNSTTRETLNGMWGPTADDLWFIGTNASIRHWDGQKMATVDLDPSLRNYDLFGITGTGPNNIWIVGEGALVLHYDGQKFSRVAVGGLRGKRPTLRKVWVSPTSDNVWVVGDGIILGGKKGALQ